MCAHLVCVYIRSPVQHSTNNPVQSRHTVSQYTSEIICIEIHLYAWSRNIFIHTICRSNVERSKSNRDRCLGSLGAQLSIFIAQSLILLSPFFPWTIFFLIRLAFWCHCYVIGAMYLHFYTHFVLFSCVFLFLSSSFTIKIMQRDTHYIIWHYMLHLYAHICMQKWNKYAIRADIYVISHEWVFMQHLQSVSVCTHMRKYPRQQQHQ